MRVRDQIALASVERWFEDIVLGLNLCPFARRPFQDGRIGFQISNANNDEACLADLYLALLQLDGNAWIETSILVVPYHLQSFDDYNQFLSLAEQLLIQQGWHGVYQIASFHPDYCFADAPEDDHANWTNRSPYPLLHLIREDSISAALANLADVDVLAHRNMDRLRNLSAAEMRILFGARYQSQALLSG